MAICVKVSRATAGGMKHHYARVTRCPNGKIECPRQRNVTIVKGNHLRPRCLGRRTARTCQPEHNQGTQDAAPSHSAQRRNAGVSVTAKV